MKILFTYWVICIALSQNLQAQTLLQNSKIVLYLEDNTKVICYKSLSLDNRTNSYYYLPVNLRFSLSNQGKKTYSFFLYNDENNQPIGGIMHWLLSWGLNKDQLNEARALLKIEVDENAILMGAILAEKNSLFKGFEIKGNNTISQILRKSLNSIGNTPILANTNVAASFKFNEKEANIIQHYFNNPNKLNQVIIAMHFIIPLKKLKKNIYKYNWTLSQDLQKLISF